MNRLVSDKIDISSIRDEQGDFFQLRGSTHRRYDNTKCILGI